METEALNGWGKNCLPQYITEGNVRYELVFNDIDNIDDGYRKLPLGFDVSCFAVALHKDNISTHINKDCNTGCFFVPYINILCREDLACCVSKLAARLGEQVSKIEKTTSPSLRVVVSKYVDEKGNRSFAIGGTNFKPKSEIIHNLNIQTMLCEPIIVPSEESWFAVLADMQDVHEAKTLTVKRESILDFEKRKITIDNKNKHALTLLPKESTFFAKHLVGGSSNNFFNPKKQLEGCVYGLSTIRVSSEEETNIILRRLVESFRSLTGSCFIEALVLSQEHSGGIADISVAVVEGDNPYLNENDDDEA
jgi:hypothetical protein